MLWRNSFFIAVASDGPYQTVPALIAAARANPGKLSYGTPCIGSPSHLGSALFECLTGTKMIHAPFNNVTQIFVSVANGNVSWAFGTLGSTEPIVKTGSPRRRSGSGQESTRPACPAPQRRRVRKGLDARDHPGHHGARTQERFLGRHPA